MTSESYYSGLAPFESQPAMTEHSDFNQLRNVVSMPTSSLEKTVLQAEIGPLLSYYANCIINGVNNRNIPDSSLRDYVARMAELIK